MTQRDEQAGDYAAEQDEKMTLEEFGAAIDAQTRTLPVREAKAPRTVRVRIAVIVDAEGHWAAYACGTGEKLGMSSAETMATAREMMTDFVGVEHWIEADVPLPGQQTVRGEVVQ